MMVAGSDCRLSPENSASSATSFTPVPSLEGLQRKRQKKFKASDILCRKSKLQVRVYCYILFIYIMLY